MKRESSQTGYEKILQIFNYKVYGLKLKTTIQKNVLLVVEIQAKTK